MFRKYEKTYRILVPQINVKGKHFLSKDEMRALLGGEVTLLEKLDGANTGIIPTRDWFRLQKRGSLVDASEHHQFNFFKAWSEQNYEKLIDIPKHYRVYGELMRCVHTVNYNKLPDWFVVFGIFDTKLMQYLSWNNVIALCDGWGLSTVPTIANGVHVEKMDLFNLIPDVSGYGDEAAEGLVVWNYRRQMRGKLVREEFVKHMDNSGHWMTKELKFNSLI
jgi:hypothetical protein